MNKLIATILLILLVLPVSASERPIVKGVMADQPPIIDGDISDACWQTAPSVSDFYFPSDGSPAPEPTTAWICYDQKNIYAAFHCKDSKPDTIQCQQKKRGGGTYTDDYVEVAIACYPTQGHIAWFLVTAGGVQDEHFDWADVSKIEWRGDWKAAVKRVEDGYTAEIMVPFSILQYNADQTSLGICFERRLPRLDQSWISPNIGHVGGYQTWYLWDGLVLPRPNIKPKLMGYSLVGAGRSRVWARSQFIRLRRAKSCCGRRPSGNAGLLRIHIH